MKKRLFIPDSQSYARPFLRQFELTNDLTKADCLLLTGGEDVDPATYGQKPRHGTYFTPSRDVYEIKAFNQARERGLPTIGICRGAQLLCALAGGTLVQDTTGHGRSHPIVTKDGREYWMTSLHHQMLMPEKTDHVLIAWAKERLSKHYLGQNDEELYGHDPDAMGRYQFPKDHKEPEIVWFPKIKGLAIQGHPEAFPIDHPTVDYCNELVQEYCFADRT